MPTYFSIQSECACTTLATPRSIRILRAAHLGMCFGVRDAIALACQEVARGPLTVLGDLVHNETVLADLRRRGVVIKRDTMAVATPTVMITAHGASQRAVIRLRGRGLRVLEATCPLVRYVQHCARELAAAAYHPVIVGQRDHVEVRGITEDLTSFDVVLTEDDVDRLAERPRFGVLAQTTQPVEKVRWLVALMRRRFPRSDVRFVDTVCQPTKLRQVAAAELARQSDVVIVIGGAQSNNTRELVATCSRFCERVHHVQMPDDLQTAWFADAATVGLTAGTSTPDAVIDAVESRARELAGAERSKRCER
ncbi:MAG: 4-hydroxy-3-methylbut-2-enyl diphosphate reductase [Verrucomicrobia bacterium]|nr:4-hydroxy-3-methylbut-2-enyl diphosphate reductase [Verrucomicrobiota bacterium]